MAVDLGDLIQRARDEVSVPGGDLFPNASDDDWINSLASAFWDAHLNGFFVGFVELDGEVTPVVDGDPDLTGAEQQMIVLWTGFRSVRAQLLRLPTKSRSKAGPVETETERSATILRDLLKDFRGKIEQLRTEIVGTTRTPTYAFDAVLARFDSFTYSDTSWTR